MFKKLVIIAWISLFSANLVNAYEEIDCSTNPIYSQNSCNQCFDWGEVKNDTPIGFFTDIWSNKTTSDKILYKEEQVMPTFIPLNETKLEQNPQDDSFWQYTSDLEALKSQTLSGYVLPAWKDVTWLKSSDWAWFKMQNLPWKSENAWIMIYEIMSHPVNASWVVDATDIESHKECVLYKSGEETVVVPPTESKPTPPTPKEMTKVQTWPGEVLAVIMLSLLLAVWILNRRVILAKIRK